MLEIGRRLADRGQITEPPVTWRRGERAQAMMNPGPARCGTPPPGPPSLRSLPAEARFANEAFMWDVELALGPTAGDSSGDGDLTGVAASPGNYAGAVRVIRRLPDGLATVVRPISSLGAIDGTSGPGTRPLTVALVAEQTGLAC